ncbi:MAG TPA: serine--tRNA ligase, partial [archaeon]|nr:serine--tRNA ligase [archaeon]
MLDIKLIREQPEVILENLAKRNDHANVHMLHELIEADRERRDIIQDVEKLRQKRNTITKTISELKAQGKDASVSMKDAEEIPKQIKQLDERLAELDTICRNLL